MMNDETWPTETDMDILWCVGSQNYFGLCQAWGEPFLAVTPQEWAPV